MNILNLTADEILSIEIPEKLFSRDNFILEARQLLSIWHPDKSNSPLANQVSARINVLFDLAEKKVDNWTEPGVFKFTNTAGAEFKVRYYQSRELPIGTMYYGKTVVAYNIDNSNQDLNDNVSQMMTKLSRVSAGMRKEFDKYLPKIKQTIKTKNSTVFIFEKTEDVIPLSDMLDLVDGKLGPKHVAWVGNRLFNLACFLSHNKLTYNAFTLDNIWVSPQFHSALLIGGWWYSKTCGDKLIAIPGELLNILPEQVKKDKIAHIKYDLIAIKHILLKLLGDKTGTGMSLLKDKSIPKLMLDQLRTPVMGDSIQEYKSWGKTVDDSFGERKFIKLEIDISKLYKEVI